MKFSIGDRVVWYGAYGIVREVSERLGKYLVDIDGRSFSVYESELTLSDNDEHLSRWEGEGGNAHPY